MDQYEHAHRIVRKGWKVRDAAHINSEEPCTFRIALRNGEQERVFDAVDMPVNEVIERLTALLYDGWSFIRILHVGEPKHALSGIFTRRALALA